MRADHLRCHTSGNGQSRIRRSPLLTSISTAIRYRETKILRFVDRVFRVMVGALFAKEEVKRPHTIVVTLSPLYIFRITGRQWTEIRFSRHATIRRRGLEGCSGVRWIETVRMRSRRATVHEYTEFVDIRIAHLGRCYRHRESLRGCNIRRRKVGRIISSGIPRASGV